MLRKSNGLIKNENEKGNKMAELQVKLEPAIESLVKSVDINTTSLKKFIKLLSAEMDMDCKPHKDFIKETLREAIAKLNPPSESENEDDEEEAVPAKKRGGGLSAKKEISPALAKFLGQGNEMARTEIVKALWAYIREHSLQNPENGKEIILDDAMKAVFETDRFTMFSMNKYIGAHIHPFKPVDLSASSTPSKKRRSSQKSPKGEKKKRKTGTQPPYRLSEELQAVVSKDVLPRPQVVSAIWTYIKAHDLQNPNDKREILCDDKLQAVMKKSRVSMFKMNQLITPHLIEKVDKAEYQHEDEQAEAGDSDDE